jgi:hypothetical protein
VLVTGEEVARPKPAPDAYVAAAVALGAAPSECAVLEDSPTGVAAGRAAGALTIGVPSVPGVTLEADVVAASLEDPAVWLALGSRRRPPKLDRVPLASLGDDISSFFNAVGKFFSSLADIHFGALVIALIAVRPLPDHPLAGGVPHPARRLPAGADRVPAHLGGLHRGLRASTTSSRRAAATSSGSS